MQNKDFEGSLVLEKLAEINLLDEFWEAIDSDDLEDADRLMAMAKIDIETRNIVLEKMKDPGQDH